MAVKCALLVCMVTDTFLALLQALLQALPAVLQTCCKPPLQSCMLLLCPLCYMQLLEQLQEYQRLINMVLTSSGVLVLHNPSLLLQLHSVNIVTRESSPPSNTHYLHAAQRLRLTSEQLSHLRLIFQQFNRMSKQQREDGMQIVGLSAHSFSLQASLAAAADTSTGCSTGQQCDTASASGLTAAALGNSSASQSAAAAARQSSQEADCEDAAEQHKDDQQAVLEGLLQQHLHNRLDTLKVRYS